MGKESYQIPALCRNCPRYNQPWEIVKESCIMCNGTTDEKYYNIIKHLKSGLKDYTRTLPEDIDKYIEVMLKKLLKMEDHKNYTELNTWRELYEKNKRMKMEKNMSIPPPIDAVIGDNPLTKRRLINKISNQIRFDVGEKVIFKDGDGDMHVGIISCILVIRYRKTAERCEVEYEIYIDYKKDPEDIYNAKMQNIYPYNEKDAKLIMEYRKRWKTT